MRVAVKHGVQSKQQVPYMMLLVDNNKKLKRFLARRHQVRATQVNSLQTGLLVDDDVKYSLVGHAQVKGNRDEGSTFCCCL